MYWLVIVSSFVLSDLPGFVVEVEIWLCRNQIGYFLAAAVTVLTCVFFLLHTDTKKKWSAVVGPRRKASRKKRPLLEVNGGPHIWLHFENAAFSQKLAHYRWFFATLVGVKFTVAGERPRFSQHLKIVKRCSVLPHQKKRHVWRMGKKKLEILN